MTDDRAATDANFAAFMEWLDAGVPSDGRSYVEMHARLVLYFARKGCAVIVPVLSGLVWDLTKIPATAFVPMALCALALAAFAPSLPIGRGRVRGTELLRQLAATKKDRRY